MGKCSVCNSATEASQNYSGDACSLLISAYILAGLAMMLNIRLSYSSAPYALIRFKLPENLFSVFVRRMASALELWCLPSMLLGNIIDLTQKLIDENPELRAIKAKASEIQTKATALKNTTETQSKSELGSTHENDLKSGNLPQNKLTDKAGELKGKAQELYNQAQKLEQAAQKDDPLKPLSAAAGQLKTAAKNGGTSLYYAAEQLAQAKTYERPSDEANNVITEFEEVEKKYLALMEKAKESGLTHDPKVTEIVKAYHDVKNNYYQILITYRIKNKAGVLHGKAYTLQARAEAASQTSPLKKLKDTASHEMTQLVDKANQLQSITLGAEKDSDIVTYYRAVLDAYAKLSKIPAFKEASSVSEVTKVKEAINPLMKSIENVLKLRVQELYEKAEKLKQAANDVSVDGLRGKATLLATAASGGGGGLKEKAEALVTAINTSDGDTDESKATQVITQFDTVTIAYEALMNAVTPEQKDKPAVKAVDDAYNALKILYNSILNITKIKHYADQVYSKAQSITSVDNAKEVKDLIGKLESVYNSIPDDQADIKSTVQNDFDSIKKIITGAMKWWKFFWIIVPSIVTQWLNFLTYVILLIVYLMGGDQGHLTTFYFVIAISGVVFGINMTLLYSVDFYYIPVYIVGENSFPILTSFIHYLATLMFGNRRKWNSDFLLVKIDICVAIIISFAAAVVWTVGYLCELDDSGEVKDMKHIHAFGFGGNPHWEQISPFLMIVVGMGLVYAIYPGIAPGMIVPFYLIDKIEMVLLVATLFPPVIVALLRKYKKEYSPQYFAWPAFQKWTEYPAGKFYLFLDILMVIKITLAAIFIYSLHYRGSHLSRSIINQPKMSTFLSITFYMCHECLLALGFSGFIGNDGGDYILIPQYIGALFMIFLAFYSEGYIIEYKSHDPAHCSRVDVVLFCDCLIGWIVSPHVFIMIKLNVYSY